MAGRVARKPGLPRVLIAVHEHSALAGLIAIAVHGLTLLGDRWLDPGPVGLAVPFAMASRPLWTGLGIIGGYLAAALGLSFYVRERIGHKRWRSLHKLTILVYVLGVAHAVGAGAGTTKEPWMVAQLVTQSGVPVGSWLFVMRVLRPSPRNDLSGGGSGARRGSARCPAARSARSRP